MKNDTVFVNETLLEKKITYALHNPPIKNCIASGK